MGGQYAPGKGGKKQPLTMENINVTLFLTLALNVTTLLLCFLQQILDDLDRKSVV